MPIRSIFFSKRSKLQRRRSRDERTISESKLFDPDWYKQQYPDIADYPGGPLAHYIDYGAKEGRCAGPGFDTQAYLAANADVASSGVNPLVHYIRHGVREGRGFASSALLPPPSPVAIRSRAVHGRPVSFSLLLARGDGADVEATIRSVAALTGANFELVIDGDGLERVEASEILSHLEQKTINVRRIESSDSCSFLRSAIAVAENEFVILLDAGDILVRNALACIFDCINSSNCDVVYCDESQFRAGATGPSPVLKPSWSPELLTAYNYFGRLTAIRRSVALAALPAASAGFAAEWDLNLRVAEQTQAIERLPLILCHRTGESAHDLSSTEFCVEDHAAVLKSYWQRRGYDAQLSRAQDGTFRATWAISCRPLVSVIIPNKNQPHLLRICVEGLYSKTAYDNIELIIVDNGSTDPKTLALYEELKARSVRVVAFNEVFNYSRACNLGASAAKGEFLLFLNNDIEVVHPNWLDELVRQASEPGVGVVGAKLLYPDGEVQHAGVALGLFTLAAHVFHRTPQDVWGPFGTPDCTRNWMAVTGACQLIRRDIFDVVGGYDEKFILSYSDVVLCMDAVRAGFRTVYLPSAVLVHHEGASRGYTNPSSDQILFAKRVRALGVAADPYFHPSLDTTSFAPKIARKSHDEDSSQLQIDIERLAGPRDFPLDIYDDGAVASAAKMPWGAVTWRFDPTHMRPELKTGAQILIELLRRRSDLRARFPAALRDGPDGGFAVWVKTEGLKLLGLGQEYARWIDAAFAANLGAASRKVLFFDEALRRSQPLYLLPSGMNETTFVLFRALLNGGLTFEDLWWFLISNAENAQTALCETWALTPSWQERVPDGGTVFGVVKLAKWVSDTYDCRDDTIFAQTYPAIMSDAAQVRLAYSAQPAWRERFPNAMTEDASAQSLLRYLASRSSGLHFLPRAWVTERLQSDLAREIVRPGVNILGHFSYPSGLRISTESIVEGLRANGIGLSLRNVPVSASTDDPIGHNFTDREVYDITLIHVQPEPLFNTVYEISGLLPREIRTYRIGYWYWEFDEVPDSWNWPALECDELWTATEFIADGLRKHYRQPVHVFTPGIEIASFKRLPRSTFGLQDSEFVFAFVFHMTSVMDRKNPLGLIEAFKQAFKDEPRAKLVIKTSFGEEHPSSLALLKDAVVGANIALVDRTFTRDETLSLIAASDAYVSLHRSEGLGLTMAEAMLLGKPVIATRFSGNLDFMDDENSLLVDYRLVTLDHDVPPYRAGLSWAEPSIAHAAKQMRKLFEMPELARSLGERAKADLERRFNYRTAGRAMATRLAELGESE